MIKRSANDGSVVEDDSRRAFFTLLGAAGATAFAGWVPRTPILAILASIALSLASAAARADALTDQIRQVYRDTYGREALDWEITVWRDNIQHQGWTIPAMRLTFANDQQCRDAITTVYQEIVNRTPDTWAVDIWQGNIIAGSSIPGMRIVFSDSDQCRDAIVKVYQDTLDRTPETWEVNAWRNNLAVNRWSIAGMRTAFVDSGGCRDAIVAVYWNYYWRTPDTWEINVWRENLLQGSSIAQMRANFIADPQCRSAIRSVYLLILNREPDAWEVDAWQTNFSNGSTIDQMRGLFIDSDEFSNIVAAQYREIMGRAPSPEEIEYWRARFREGWYYLRATLLQSLGATIDELSANPISVVPQQTTTVRWVVNAGPCVPPLCTLVLEKQEIGGSYSNLGQQPQQGQREFVMTRDTVFTLTLRVGTLPRSRTVRVNVTSTERTDTYRANFTRRVPYEGPIYYADTFGEGIPNGHINYILNPNSFFRIAVVKRGHSSAECFSRPEATVVLNPQARTTSQDLVSIFGTATPLLSQYIVFCSEGPDWQFLPVDINYSWRP